MKTQLFVSIGAVALAGSLMFDPKPSIGAAVTGAAPAQVVQAAEMTSALAPSPKPLLLREQATLLRQQGR